MSPELQQAVRLIKSGQKQEGKEILLQILNEDEANDMAWVWLTATVDNDKMRLECLEEALKINPDNETAKKGYQKISHRLQRKQEKSLEMIWDDDTPAEANPSPFTEPVQEMTSSQKEWSYYDYQQKPEPELPKPSTGVLNTTKNPFRTSPWFTIWYVPRTTIKAIIGSKDPEKHVLLIASVVGIINGLSGVFPFAELSGDYLWLGFIFSLILGPLFTIIELYISAAIFNWIAFFLGGNGSSRDVRVAIAWSYIPNTIVITLLNLHLYVNSTVSTLTNSGAQTNPISSASDPLACLYVPLLIWAVYIRLQSLGAAQQFSAWRALLTLAMPMILIFLCACSTLYLILITTPYY